MDYLRREMNNLRIEMDYLHTEMNNLRIEMVFLQRFSISIINFIIF